MFGNWFLKSNHLTKTPSCLRTNGHKSLLQTATKHCRNISKFPYKAKHKLEHLLREAEDMLAHGSPTSHVYREIKAQVRYAIATGWDLTGETADELSRRRAQVFRAAADGSVADMLTLSGWSCVTKPGFHSSVPSRRSTLSPTRNPVVVVPLPYGDFCGVASACPAAGEGGASLRKHSYAVRPTEQTRKAQASVPGTFSALVPEWEAMRTRRVRLR